MFNHDDKTQKLKVYVNIDLANGDKIEGCFFAAQGQRLLDLMNDERAFIPVSNADDKIIIVQKSSIIQITPIAENCVITKQIPSWARA